MKWLLFALLFSSVTFAKSSIEAEFEDFYYSNQINPRFCKKNILGFLDSLESKGIDTSEFEVLEITAPRSSWGFGKMIALNSRWGREVAFYNFQTFGYHVIAIYKDKVIDFSFGPEPKLLSYDEYIEEMYLVDEDILLYGPSFSLRGQSYYTRELSIEHVSDFEIKKVDH